MVSHAFDVILSGGPIMAALAVTSLLMYKTIIGLLVFVRRVQFKELTEERLHLLEHTRPSDSILDRNDAMQQQAEAFNETLWRFKRLIRSRIKYSQSLLIAAPLLGLLGTVMGMLDTFRGLSLQLGHETARTVADGISRALITTETGLMIAIPALFLIRLINRESQRQELRILEMKMQTLQRLET